MAEKFKNPPAVGFDPFAAENAKRQPVPSVVPKQPPPPVTKPVPKGTKKAPVVKKGSTSKKSTGGGGGGGGGSAPTATPGAVSQTDVMSALLSKRPDLAWAINHPELGPILAQADSLGPAELQAKLYATTWWKTNGEKGRQWQALLATDPETARLQFEEMRARVGDIANQLGGNWDSGNIDQTVADQAIRFGWTEQQITDELIRRARPGTASGLLSANQTALRETALQFGQKVSDDTLWQWSTQVAGGQQTIETIADRFRNQAKVLFPHLASQIDGGQTVQQIFDPYRQEIAQLLEVSPSTINFVDSPKWQSVIDNVNEKGEHRMLSLGETQKYVRGMHEWRGTSQAKQQVAEFGEDLLQSLGKVA